jgi:hypothetical protein
LILIIALSFILIPISHPTTSLHADPFRFNLVSAGIECPGMRSGARVQARISQFHSSVNSETRSMSSSKLEQGIRPWGPIQISTFEVAIALTRGRARMGSSFHITDMNDGGEDNVNSSSALAYVRLHSIRAD